MLYTSTRDNFRGDDDVVVCDQLSRPRPLHRLYGYRDRVHEPGKKTDRMEIVSG